MKIEHISVSRSGLWNDTCRYCYKLKYHLKLTPNKPQQYYFFYGKLCHRAAEVYIQEKGQRTLNEITNDIIAGKIEVEEGTKFIPLPIEYKKRLPGNLRAIENLTKQIGYNGEVEWPFELDIDPPNEKMLSGVIDRLIEKNGKYFIIDYKTTKKGRYRKDSLSIKRDLQLRTYAWAVQQKFNVEADNIRVALHYLEGGDLICCKFTQRAIDEAIKDLKTTYDQIKSADPNKVVGNVGEWCNRCDYNDICPFYKKN